MTDETKTLYLYKGTVTDTLDFDGKEIYLTPESQVELSDEFQNYPYFQRMIANGTLLPVSPAETPKEAK